MFLPEANCKNVNKIVIFIDIREIDFTSTYLSECTSHMTSLCLGYLVCATWRSVPNILKVSSTFPVFFSTSYTQSSIAIDVTRN